MDLERLRQTLLQQKYIMSLRPAFKKGALYSDTSGEFVSPCEPKPNEEVTITFRTAKQNVDSVELVTEGRTILLSEVVTKGEFDYYSCKVKLGEEKFKYHFEIMSGRHFVCFDARGVVPYADNYYDFVLIPGFSTPDWAKGAVMYQIYVDRFNNGDKNNDVYDGEYIYLDKPVKKVKDWDSFPEGTDIRNFYGGDLQGVLDKMDYLKDLGVDVIYFNPLFVSPSNHKYDIQDYDHIDPHFGVIVKDGDENSKSPDEEDKEAPNRNAQRYITRVTDEENLEASNELFAKVVKEAHKRGMRVIMDGVFNHCGSFNKWVDKERIYENAKGYEKGAYVSKESPYRDYFDFKDENAWPYNLSYDGWWGYKTLPKLNYENSEELCEYILKIGAKWVSKPFCADGWRLDVAADLGHSSDFNHKFWKRFREAVKKANPEAIILAEHYGSTREWLSGNEWDTVMNYDAFMEPVTWFLTGMEKHSDAFREDMLGNSENFWNAIKYHSANFTFPSFSTAMNELSNHDHSRFLTRTNHKVGRVTELGSFAAAEGTDKAVFREAVVMQMTWIGAPTIYYGDEAGLCGFTDPDNRRSYPWGHEDKELIDFHKDIIALRRENPALRYGCIKPVHSDHDFLAYARFTKEDAYAIVVNNNPFPITRNLVIWEIGTPKKGSMQVILQTSEDGYYLDGPSYEMQSGRITLEMPAHSATIMKYVKGQ